MIKLTTKYYNIFPVKEYWFCDNKKEIINSKPWFFWTINFYQTNLSLDLKNKKIFNTWIIDLNKNLEEIFKNFNSSTKWKINKINRLISWEQVSIFNNTEYKIDFIVLKNPNKQDIKEFIKFYNKFAKQKWLHWLNINIFNKFNKNIIITKILLNNIATIFHVYLIDNDDKITRLLYSASLFRNENKDIKKLIWWLNHWHHYKDIELFQNLYFNTYDFWGIYQWKDISKTNIAKFKIWFWPQLITQYHYIKEWFLFKYLYKIKKKILW